MMLLKDGAILLVELESFAILIASSNIAFNWSAESSVFECNRLTAFTNQGSSLSIVFDWASRVNNRLEAARANVNGAVL